MNVPPWLAFIWDREKLDEVAARPPEKEKWKGQAKLAQEVKRAVEIQELDQAGESGISVDQDQENPGSA